MNMTKRPVFVVLAIAVLSLAPGAIFADVIQDCKKSCSDRKTSDDTNCPGADQGMDQGRAECLKNNQDIFNNCMQNCSPSTPPAAATPKTAAPQGTATQGTAPQAGATQGATTQGATPQETPPIKVLTPP